MDQKLINLLREFTEVEDLADFGKMDSLMEKARNLLAEIKTDHNIIYNLTTWYDKTSFMNQQRIFRDIFDPNQEEMRELMRVIDLALADRNQPISNKSRFEKIENGFRKLRFDPNKLWNYLKETI